MKTLPPIILTHLRPFRTAFLTNKTYLKACLLMVGALMCQGGRTICAILQILGLKGESAFAKYHHVLNRSKWDALKAGKILLQQLDQDQTEPLNIVIDGHLERRRGSKIKARGHYRDPIQSGNNYTVISSGIKWLSVMALKRFSWCRRTLALPFLTILVPSEEGNKIMGKSHKTLQAWTCQAIMQIRRWLPNRKINLTADNEFATAAIALSCIKHKITFVSRLKLNARLFEFPFQNHMGRPRKKGLRLPSIQSILADKDVQWITSKTRWYAGTSREVQYITGVCLWHVMTHSSTPILIRYVLIRDPEEKFKPVLLMSTDIEMEPTQIIEIYVSRWNVEVTFHETRAHLGIETQRQWSDLAIKRTTPVLFGLYSLAVLIGNNLINQGLINIYQAAWYKKDEIKFSDIMKGIRKHVIETSYFCKETFLDETNEKSNEDFLNRVIDLFLYAV